MPESFEAGAFRIGQLLYLMAPAYAANMVPPLTRFWRGWNRPISTRCLGSHKTIVGFLAGVVTAVVITWLQARIAWQGAPAHYASWFELGLCLGVGAMAGDSAKSFFKRRLGVPPGKPWVPWDQLDFVLGALVFVVGRAALSWVDVAAIQLLSAAGHIAVNHVAYWTRVRDVKW